MNLESILLSEDVVESIVENLDYLVEIIPEIKKDKRFFDFPIKDFNIKKGEALFIDDTEINLDAAKEKGFDVLLMDREKVVSKSKYKIIHNLSNL